MLALTYEIDGLGVRQVVLVGAGSRLYGGGSGRQADGHAAAGLGPARLRLSRVELHGNVGECRGHNSNM